MPQGGAVQIDPMEPKLKLPGTKPLKLMCDVLLSTSAFKVNLRRYTKAGGAGAGAGGTVCLIFHIARHVIG